MGKWKPDPRLVRAGRQRARSARPPMSAILGELIAHITERSEIPETESGYEAWLELCKLAWNASRLALQGEHMRALVDEAHDEACRGNPNITAVYGWIFEIACRDFPTDRRVVTGASIRVVDSGVVVHATSSEID
ncbi:hypothetical protein LBMAG42_03560 [Deltaproteobacteria bacterium]|nr:hypothetical protein LBMAG42_03560 [Deltaproteobacteria bacterium]